MTQKMIQPNPDEPCQRARPKKLPATKEEKPQDRRRRYALRGALDRQATTSSHSRCFEVEFNFVSRKGESFGLTRRTA